MPADAERNGSTVALDTSAAIPFLVRSHAAHDAVRRALSADDVVLTGHSLAETYAVLTRLPSDARVTPEDARRLLTESFGPPAVMTAGTTMNLSGVLSSAGVAGGATYDGLVGLAAQEHGLTLVTRDARAMATYGALGVAVRVIGDDRGVGGTT